MRGIRHWRPAGVALAAASLGAAGFIAVGGAHALAAETHPDTGCISGVDGSGNPIFIPNCSVTTHDTSGPSYIPAADPCTGVQGLVTINDDHDTFHVNVDGAGDAWLTGTDGGTATVQLEDGTDGSGTWTAWFGVKLNNQTTVNGSTFTVRLDLSDGTHIVVHMVQHMTLNPNGVPVSFGPAGKGFAVCNG